MPEINPQSPRLNRSVGRAATPILKSQIEEAQRNTNSNMSAARYLEVSYPRYKKYAKLYNLFDDHLNQSGFGVDKGFSKNPNNTPLKEVLEGKHPNYSPAKLKNRLIARKKLEEKCYLCGFCEKRITDQKLPLILNFIDNDRTNFKIGNLNLLCYNCIFLTAGAPTVVYRRSIERSFTAPDELPKRSIAPDITTADHYDKDDDTEDLWDVNLSPNELRQLLDDDLL